MCRRSRSSASSRTFRPSRPLSAAAAIRSIRRGSRRNIGSNVASSSVAVRRNASGARRSVTCAAANWRDAATRSNPGEMREMVPSTVASARNTAATSGGTPRSCEVMILNRSLNIAGPSADPGGEVTGHELADGALEAAFVDDVGAVDDLQQGVGRGDRIAVVDREQEPLQRLPGGRIEPADRAEVEHADPAVGEEQEVARVRVGVEDPVDRDLTEDAVEQHAAEPGRVQAAVGDRLGGAAESDAVQPLHRSAPGGYTPAGRARARPGRCSRQRIGRPRPCSCCRPRR